MEATSVRCEVTRVMTIRAGRAIDIPQVSDRIRIMRITCLPGGNDPAIVMERFRHLLQASLNDGS